MLSRDMEIKGLLERKMWCKKQRAALWGRGQRNIRKGFGVGERNKWWDESNWSGFVRKWWERVNEVKKK